MSVTRANSVSIFAILGVAGLILTGCSSSDTPESAGTSSAAPSSAAPAAEEQSLEEACTVVIEGMTEMETSIMGDAEQQAELQSDPEAMDAAFAEVLALLEDNIAQVTNEDVKPIAEDIGSVFQDIGVLRTEAASDPENIDEEASTAVFADLTAATTKLQEVCGA